MKVLTRAEKREVVRLCTQHRGAYKGSADPHLSTGAISERSSEAWSCLARIFGASSTSVGRVVQDGTAIHTANFDPNMLKGLEHMFANRTAYLGEITRVLRPIPIRQSTPPRLDSVASPITSSASQAQLSVNGPSSRNS